MSVTKAEMREAAIAVGIPADDVDRLLGDGLVLLVRPDLTVSLKVALEPKWCNATPPDRDWPVCAREPGHGPPHQSADLEWYEGEPTLYPRV